MILLILRAVFRFPLSVTHAAAEIFPGNSGLSRIFSLKFQQRAKASLISYPELLATTPSPGNFAESVETVGSIGEHDTWSSNRASQFWRGEKPCTHRVGKRPQEYT